jgi:hypothetical protein
LECSRSCSLSCLCGCRSSLRSSSQPGTAKPSDNPKSVECTQVSILSLHCMHDVLILHCIHDVLISFVILFIFNRLTMTFFFFLHRSLLYFIVRVMWIVKITRWAVVAVPPIRSKMMKLKIATIFSRALLVSNFFAFLLKFLFVLLILSFCFQWYFTYIGHMRIGPEMIDVVSLKKSIIKFNSRVHASQPISYSCLVSFSATNTTTTTTTTTTLYLMII